MFHPLCFLSAVPQGVIQNGARMVSQSLFPSIRTLPIRLVTHTHTHTHTRTRTHTHTHTHTHIDTPTETHTIIHLRKNTHAHTHKPILQNCNSKEGNIALSVCRLVCCCPNRQMRGQCSGSGTSYINHSGLYASQFSRDAEDTEVRGRYHHPKTYNFVA